jgi:hypothetical protein
VWVPVEKALPNLHAISTPQRTWCRLLRKRQCKSHKKRPDRLNRWVVHVDVEEFELLVEEICCSNGEETIALWQTVTDHRIDGPEVITTGPSGVIEERLKRAVLIPIRGR